MSEMRVSATPRCTMTLAAASRIWSRRASESRRRGLIRVARSPERPFSASKRPTGVVSTMPGPMIGPPRRSDGLRGLLAFGGALLLQVRLRLLLRRLAALVLVRHGQLLPARSESRPRAHLDPATARANIVDRERRAGRSAEHPALGQGEHTPVERAGHGGIRSRGPHDAAGQRRALVRAAVGEREEP